eukprot:366218-Chlamydomonas_euryale.AAC.3
MAGCHAAGPGSSGDGPSSSCLRNGSQAGGPGGPSTVFPQRSCGMAKEGLPISQTGDPAADLGALSEGWRDATHAAAAPAAAPAAPAAAAAPVSAALAAAPAALAAVAAAAAPAAAVAAPAVAAAPAAVAAVPAAAAAAVLAALFAVAEAALPAAKATARPHGRQPQR